MKLALFVASLLLAVTLVSVETIAGAPLDQKTNIRAARVVGTWRLVSASASGSGGKNNLPFGAAPTGMLNYLPDGRMMLILSYAGRRPLTSGDRVSASVAERADAFSTSFAYAGHYSIVGDNVVHHVEISTVENWVNTDLLRLVRFDGGKLVLTTPPISVGGTLRVTELVWERLK